MLSFHLSDNCAKVRCDSARSGDFWIRAHVVHCINEFVCYFVLVWIQKINSKVTTDENDFLINLWKRCLDPVIKLFYARTWCPIYTANYYIFVFFSTDFNWYTVKQIVHSSWHIFHYPIVQVFVHILYTATPPPLLFFLFMWLSSYPSSSKSIPLSALIHVMAIILNGFVILLK